MTDSSYAAPRRRRILVTGGSRGIGAAVCRAFADLGDVVAVHYGTSRAAADEVLASLPGSGHALVQADLRDAEQVRTMVDAAAEALGGIDVLVNNAGVFYEHHVDEVSYEVWQQAWADTLGVNLVGAANASFCALRHMPRDGSARIVNVGSRGAFRGEPRNPAYGASKAGIAALGQSLAKALGGSGVSVTTVAPGFVETDMAGDELEGERGVRRRAESPFDRVARPEEIAAAVVYLASQQAQWASGAILDLNGASHLRM
jgi:NAD(P)-dependent dehydrogenase (short-subunit alcohol dehydrogenase family)